MSYCRSSYALAICVVLAGLIVALPVAAHGFKEQLAEIHTKWLHAFEQKDIATIEAIQAPNALLLPPGNPPVKGPEAIAKVWKSWAELPDVTLHFASARTEVARSGDLAYDFGTYTFAFDGEDGRVTNNGKYVVVWKKVDGAWRVAADIFNLKAGQ